MEVLCVCIEVIQEFISLYCLIHKEVGTSTFFKSLSLWKTVGSRSVKRKLQKQRQQKCEVVASLQAFVFLCSWKLLDFGFMALITKTRSSSNFRMMPCLKTNPSCIVWFPFPKNYSRGGLYMLLLSFALSCHLNSKGKIWQS